jgi:hydrogenase maturation protease
MSKDVAMNNSKPALVLGVGNLLMGDEGVGVHAARQLASEPLPSTVEVLDGGTGGFHLLSLFKEYDPIILIDATQDGDPPGTVKLVKPKFASDFPRTLSAHDIGLRDLLETAQLLGPLPTLYLITVSIGELQEMSVELSPSVSGAVEEILRVVHGILGTSGEECR